MTSLSSSAASPIIIHLYRSPGDDDSCKRRYLDAIKKTVSVDVIDIRTEYCFNIGLADEGVDARNQCGLTKSEKEKLHWLFSETYQTDRLLERTHFKNIKGAL